MGEARPAPPSAPPPASHPRSKTHARSRSDVSGMNKVSVLSPQTYFRCNLLSEGSFNFVNNGFYIVTINGRNCIATGETETRIIRTSDVFIEPNILN